MGTHLYSLKSNLQILYNPLKTTMAPSNRSKKLKRPTLKFSIDCSQPVDDGILDLSAFLTYLDEHVKVDGKLNNHDKVKMELVAKSVTVTTNIAFSKRYLKYLTKRYLKKSNLREWLRVVADKKESYTLKYFNINQDDEESDEDLIDTKFSSVMFFFWGEPYKFLFDK